MAEPAPPAVRFVDAGGLRWHVRCGGAAPGQGAPRLLLLHGTGASVHSFAALTARLGAAFEWLAPDLPGHGDSGSAPREMLTLPGMARAVHALLQALSWQPEVLLGHSAGAAVAVRLALDGRVAPRLIVAVNGAFLPFGGPAAPLLTPLARLLYAQAWVPRLFARRAADPAVVRRLIEGTGSRLDADGVAAYQRLMTQPGHSEAALGMMAHWDLRPLAGDLSRLQPPLLLLAGARDRAVAPAQARRVAALCPQARLQVLPGVGHLAHEEDPQAVAALLLAQAAAPGDGGARV